MAYLRPVSDHTKRLTAWMRRRAGDEGEPNSYFRGWYDALMEIASEIEANEREGCGHAADTEPEPRPVPAMRSETKL